MLVYALIIFAACVLTVLYWAAVVAVAVILCGLVLAILRAIWWVITRPFVWLIVRPIEYVTGVKYEEPSSSQSSVPPLPQPSIHSLPHFSLPPSQMADKVEQLGKLRALMDAGVINEVEFQKMKKEVLAG